MVAIVIMLRRLFLLGIVLFAMMTTSTSTEIMFASAGSIQQEGNAMADIARAIPKLMTPLGMNRLCAHIECLIYDFSFQ